MIPMTSKKSFEYAGRDLKPGDHFQAESQAHVDLLTASGAAVKRSEHETEAVGEAPSNRAKSSRRFRSPEH